MIDEEARAVLSEQSSYAPLPVLNELSEPQVLFMGTSSMKPS